jgi:hypothetical protein
MPKHRFRSSPHRVPTRHQSSAESVRVMIVITEDEFSIRYTGWAEWRENRVEADRQVLVAAECFCGCCWGAGRYLDEAANGEGLIPVSCHACGGRGTVSDQS